MKSNQNQQELCANLGMKFEEASELFGNETLQEMQMAQVCGGIGYFTLISGANVCEFSGGSDGCGTYTFWKATFVTNAPGDLGHGGGSHGGQWLNTYLGTVTVAYYGPTIGYLINGHIRAEDFYVSDSGFAYGMFLDDYMNFV